MPKLVIVESPAKAKTIAKFLGQGYIIESSIGHIRDLPRSAKEIPEKFKKQPWAKLGLDVEKDFKAIYIVPTEKKAQVSKLKKLLAGADELVLATDDDREGEAIAWHIKDELKPKVPVSRMVFHEITASAIKEAIQNARGIDEKKVEAQETRRALDRLYGFEVSPVLWKKVKPQLSAGRVQSVATRLLVERERERMHFVSADWWNLEGIFQASDKFGANLVELNGQKIAIGKDFDSLGQLKNEKVLRLTPDLAEELTKKLKNKDFSIISVEKKPYTTKPYPPFITSTLQQEGARKLGFSASRTMRAAQRLYEGGYITYMRTDSPVLSEDAIKAARAQVLTMYGQDFLPKSPRIYSAKSKNAQEAHEAIRPAIVDGQVPTPDSLKKSLDGDDLKLYDLIWKRTIASQMNDAQGERLAVRLEAEKAIFFASGKTIIFPGFLRAYVEGSDDPDAALEDREVVLPPLKEGQIVKALDINVKKHTTQSPNRFTEASLVANLEEKGIGRPSTYASIISTIQDRGYAFKRGQALIPTFTAFAAVSLLESFFTKLVDYNFTAQMEESLDKIAAGFEHRVPYLQHFYSEKDSGLKSLVESRLELIDAREIATIEVPKLVGTGIEVRVGRYGPFIKRDESSASIPEDLAPDELDTQMAEEILNRPAGERILGNDPESGLPVVVKSGRFGPYITLDGKNASLFPTDSFDEITLERALLLLSIPRLVGKIDEEDVFAMNGRFGPFIKCGKQNRSLKTHEDIFTITLDEAKALFATPKTRGTAKGPAKSFEYSDRKPIELRDGRFGPYLTDGELNVSVPKNQRIEDLTAEIALNLLAEKGKPPKSNRLKHGE